LVGGKWKGAGVEAEWLDLPELRNLGANLLAVRLDRGYSQVKLARECKLAQTQVSLFETGRRLPSLDQFVRLARALDVPLQRLLTGADRQGVGIKDLAVELRGLGAVDLWVVDAAVPGAARRPEEVIALAVSGGSPDPRVVETLPALLSWNEIHPAILRAHGIVTRTTYRLAWLADVALAVHRQKGFPGGCRRAPLERFLKTVKSPSPGAAWDDLGRPSKSLPPSPLWRRWKVSYGATADDFERRARELTAAREVPKGLPGPGGVHVRVTAEPTELITPAPKATLGRIEATVAPRKARKGQPDGG
jgi:transcriptional regulator with XRE-family HTH domain